MDDKIWKIQGLYHFQCTHHSKIESFIFLHAKGNDYDTMESEVYERIKKT